MVNRNKGTTLQNSLLKFSHTIHQHIRQTQLLCKLTSLRLSPLLVKSPDARPVRWATAMHMHSLGGQTASPRAQNSFSYSQSHCLSSLPHHDEGHWVTRLQSQGAAQGAAQCRGELRATPEPAMPPPTRTPFLHSTWTQHAEAGPSMALDGEKVRTSPGAQAEAAGNKARDKSERKSTLRSEVVVQTWL